MCRFLAYIGPEIVLERLVVRPPNSLVNQSFHAELHDPLNGDGFGMAWYVPALAEEPGLFRDVMPAWSNDNLLDLVRVTSSGCFLGHVRAASKGMAVVRTNCHPFRHGRYAFMHNGFVPSFRRIRRALLAGVRDEAFDHVFGTTDSEHLFALFLDEVMERTPHGEPPPESHEAAMLMVEALEATIERAVRLKRQAGIESPCFLNLAVTNGHSLIVSRFTDGSPIHARTLFVLAGRDFEVTDEGVCKMQAEPSDETPPHTVLVASEPLDMAPGWRHVPPNHIVIAEPGQRLDLVPCRLDV